MSKPAPYSERAIEAHSTVCGFIFRLNPLIFMNQQYPNCLTVAPVAKGVKRPLWSVMIPTYNCADLLRETLASVLMQDPGSDVMQITVVDNNSTDNPEAVVKELGSSRVEFYRQPKNVGSINNFQTCLELSCGKLIHLLHSDDLLLDGFYEKLAKPFDRHPNLGAAYCRSVYVDQHLNQEGFSSLELPESGILPQSWIAKQALQCRISVPSLAVVRREVYETIGSFDRRCGISADWELWVRIFANYPIWFETDLLAMWRRHSSSSNATNAKNPIFIQENFNTANAILAHVPDEVHRKIAKKMRQNCAFLALESAKCEFKNGNTRNAHALLQQGLTYSPSSRVIMSTGRILLQKAFLALFDQRVSSFD